MLPSRSCCWPKAVRKTPIPWITTSLLVVALRRRYGEGRLRMLAAEAHSWAERPYSAQYSVLTYRKASSSDIVPPTASQALLTAPLIGAAREGERRVCETGGAGVTLTVATVASGVPGGFWAAAGSGLVLDMMVTDEDDLEKGRAKKELKMSISAFANTTGLYQRMRKDRTLVAGLSSFLSSSSTHQLMVIVCRMPLSLMSHV